MASGVKREKKNFFDSVDAPLRTDEGFRGRVILNHHQEWRTPLEELDNFYLVDNAPTSEREHLCSGATFLLSNFLSFCVVYQMPSASVHQVC